MERLTIEECARLECLDGRVDYSRVRLHRAGSGGLFRHLVLWASRGRPIALGNHVFLPWRCDGDLAVLAHELTHCGQYQAWGPVRYYARGAVAQSSDLLYRTLGIGRSPYDYRLDPGKQFDEYGMEQQAMIVEDTFRGRSLPGSVGLIARAR
ncbi:MAG: hypothetical protein ACREL3_00070 [Gemmatimonadales bacterium]